MTTNQRSKGKAKIVQRRMQGPFLAAVAECGNITQAAKAVGCDRTTHYLWKRTDPTYEARYLAAIDEAVERLEQEARRRACDGVVRKIFSRGDPVIDPETGKQYEERVYSDVLLIFLLKALRPGVYREAFNMIQTTGISIQQTVQDVEAMGQTVPPPGRAMLRQLVEESEKSAGSNGNGHAVTDAAGDLKL